MNSIYELSLLAKLAHKRTIENEKKRRFAHGVRRQAAMTSDQYRQVVVREQRPCHC